MKTRRKEVPLAEIPPAKPAANQRSAGQRRSTARKGDPREASRGAAVERAKRELGDAIEAIVFDRLLLEGLAGVVGVSPAEAGERLERATLGELDNWMQRVRLLQVGGPADSAPAANRPAVAEPAASEAVGDPAAGDHSLFGPVVGRPAAGGPDPPVIGVDGRRVAGRREAG